MWRTGAPHVDQMRQGTSARILTGLVSRPYQRGVYKHRQRIFGLAGGSNSIHIPRKVPGHEDLIRSRTFAKKFLPCSTSLELTCSPYRAEFGNELFLVLLQIADQFSRDSLLEKFIGDRTAVTRIRNHADFVLDLYHDDGVVIGINFVQVTHERSEGVCVGFEIGFRKRRKYFHSISGVVL